MVGMVHKSNFWAVVLLSHQLCSIYYCVFVGKQLTIMFLHITPLVMNNESLFIWFDFFIFLEMRCVILALVWMSSLLNRSCSSCDTADKHVPFRKCQHWDSLQDWMALTHSLRWGFFSQLSHRQRGERRESESRWLSLPRDCLTLSINIAAVG